MPETTTTQPNPCNKNGQGCAADEFCLSSGCRDYNNESSCTNFECVQITNVKKDQVNGKNLYGSSSSMNWWSAKRFCKAAASQAGGSGKMVSWEDINWKCYSGEGTSVPNPTSKKSGYCKGTSESSGSNNVSETIKDLREMYCGSDKRESSCAYYPWLKDEATSYSAYYVYLSNGHVNSYGRGTSSYHALCE